MYEYFYYCSLIKYDLINNQFTEKENKEINKSKNKITRTRMREEEHIKKEEEEELEEEETLLSIFLGEVVDSEHILNDVISFVMPNNMY